MWVSDGLGCGLPLSWGSRQPVVGSSQIAQACCPGSVFSCSHHRAGRGGWALSLSPGRTVAGRMWGAGCLQEEALTAWLLCGVSSGPWCLRKSHPDPFPAPVALACNWAVPRRPVAGVCVCVDPRRAE